MGTLPKLFGCCRTPLPKKKSLLFGYCYHHCACTVIFVESSVYLSRFHHTSSVIASAFHSFSIFICLCISLSLNHNVRSYLLSTPPPHPPHPPPVICFTSFLTSFFPSFSFFLNRNILLPQYSSGNKSSMG